MGLAADDGSPSLLHQNIISAASEQGVTNMYLAPQMIGMNILHLQKRVWTMSSCRSYFCFSCLPLLTTLLLAFWPDFYISFICELSRLGGRRRGMLVSLYISVLTTHTHPPTTHLGYFDRNTEVHTFCAQIFFLSKSLW